MPIEMSFVGANLVFALRVQGEYKVRPYAEPKSLTFSTAHGN